MNQIIVFIVVRVQHRTVVRGDNVVSSVTTMLPTTFVANIMTLGTMLIVFDGRRIVLSDGLYALNYSQ